ncbi:NUDIX hydrolase domain-like protein [Panaeolus papilionaceus]|nr:NUDIX hydrolase domain-like protein [Panaeolus papilionaceus]
MERRNPPTHVLDHLSEQSRTCISNLYTFFESQEGLDLSQKRFKLAAVLVLLYEQDGILRVLLTTRSKLLRTHAGQTALPGGKKDPSDPSLMAAAYREANEEVSLPNPCDSVFTLGTLDPFISLHKLLVTPVIAFLSDTSLVSSLQAADGEVSRIFSHPLEAILDPSLAASEDLVEKGSEDWPYQDELYNTSDSIVAMLSDTSYRMHRFRTSASPVKGLTADILVCILSNRRLVHPIYMSKDSDSADCIW